MKTEIIDQIIHSFTHYGLGDIKHNKSKTIAALLLSICFIDQLASYRYNKGSLSDKWENFVTNYMKEYSGKNIYKDLRNSLIHNYSGNKKFAISNDELITEPHIEMDGITIINTNQFIKSVEKAILLFEKDMRIENSEAQINALKRYNKNPILAHRQIGEWS